MAEEVDIDGLVDYYLGALAPTESEEHSTNDMALGDVLDDPLEDIETLVDGILRGKHRAAVSSANKSAHFSQSRPDMRSENESTDSDDLQHLHRAQSAPRASIPRTAPVPRLPSSHTSSQPLAYSPSQSHSSAMLHRMALWEERREARRLQAVYAALLEEQAACPFRPSAPGPRCEDRELDSTLAGKVSGAEGFLQRMAEARERREERRRAETAEALRYADHTTWNPRVTVPRPFELGRPPRRVLAAAAQRDTFRKYGAAMRAQMEEEPSPVEGPSVPGGLFSLPSSQVVTRGANRATSA